MKLAIVLILLILVSLSYGQNDEVQYWGLPQFQDSIRWGTAFRDTDSLRLVGTLPSYMCDSLSSDTLFTDMMPLKSDGVEGILTMTFSIDSVDARADSVTLDVRFYFDKDTHPNQFWEPGWYNIWRNIKSDSLYVMRNIPADSAWWEGPSIGWQFRCIRGDAKDDSLSRPHVGILNR